MLRHIARAHVRHVAPFAVHMANRTAVSVFPQQGADERRFARAVLADQHRQLTAVDVHRHILQKRLSAAHHGDILQRNAAQLAIICHFVSLLGRFVRFLHHVSIPCFPRGFYPFLFPSAGVSHFFAYYHKEERIVCMGGFGG